jgi:hypothetical protein
MSSIGSLDSCPFSSGGSKERGVPSKFERNRITECFKRNRNSVNVVREVTVFQQVIYWEVFGRALH